MTHITTDRAAKALIRAQAELAQELIDGAQVVAAADRLQTAVDQLRAYARGRAK